VGVSEKILPLQKGQSGGIGNGQYAVSNLRFSRSGEILHR